jgi:hypothetical protein
MIDWYVEGTAFGSCNCDYACPCQFERRPTHGSCRGFEVIRIDRGHFGDVPLDSLHVALFYAWPGAVFEGGGAMQAVIDERADERQRQALATIVHGGETQEAKTHWWVFHAMANTVHEPVFAPIEFEADIDRRRASVSIPGMLEASGRPIISPATGEDHRVRIDLVNGIEFELAEIGSASAKASGPITLELDDTYGQFNVLRLTGVGIVHSRDR